VVLGGEKIKNNETMTLAYAVCPWSAPLLHVTMHPVGHGLTSPTTLSLQQLSIGILDMIYF